jgi:hypothetical protein
MFTSFVPALRFETQIVMQKGGVGNGKKGQFQPLNKPTIVTFPVPISRIALSDSNIAQITFSSLSDG